MTRKLTVEEAKALRPGDVVCLRSVELPIAVAGVSVRDRLVLVLIPPPTGRGGPFPMAVSHFGPWTLDQQHAYEANIVVR